MKANMIDGVLHLESETRDETNTLHNWFLRFQLGGVNCEAAVSYPSEFMTAEIAGEDIH